MSHLHRPLLLCAIICLLCSLVCFWCFDGRALSNEAMDGYVPASSAIGSAVQFAVCAVAGWQIGEKRPSSASRHHFPAFRWVFWPAAIIYLLFPSVRWHVSDRILYFGVTDQALTSLYAVSWVKQWLLLRAASASAVLSYLACDMACKLRTLKTKSRA